MDPSLGMKLFILGDTSSWKLKQVMQTDDTDKYTNGQSKTLHVWATVTRGFSLQAVIYFLEL